MFKCAWAFLESFKTFQNECWSIQSFKSWSSLGAGENLFTQIGSWVKPVHPKFLVHPLEVFNDNHLVIHSQGFIEIELLFACWQDLNHSWDGNTKSNVLQFYRSSGYEPTFNFHCTWNILFPIWVQGNLSSNLPHYLNLRHHKAAQMPNKMRLLRSMLDQEQPSSCKLWSSASLSQTHCILLLL